VTARPPAFGFILVYLWRLSRPEFWMVSVFPVYLGWLLATRELFPVLQLWLDFWDRSLRSGQTRGEFVVTLTAWLPLAAPLTLALLVMGPLLWAATLLINDVYDLEGDKLNERKASSPLVQGLVSRGLTQRSAYGFAGACLLVSGFVSASFLLLVLGCLVLAWLYSVPPVRLKTRPGMDVLVNAVGIGVLSALAGWSISRPLGEFPYIYLPQGFFVATAIYVPTTLWDREPDAAAGYLTIATHLGPRKAYLVGWTAWLLCNAGALLLSFNDAIIPRRMLPVLILFVPLLVWQYHIFVGKARSTEDAVRGMMLCAATFFSVNMIFALMYTGMWL